GRQIADKIKAAVAPRRFAEIVPTAQTFEQLANAFAAAAGDVLGEPFDFSAASLDRLPRWADWLEPALDDPALVFGFAAYYPAAPGECAGEPFDFSAASLDRLPRWGDWLEPALDDPALVFGFGAYYGETLRKTARAEWRIKPAPFGEWLPSRQAFGNTLVRVV